MSRNTFENRVEIIKVIFDLIFSLSHWRADFVGVEPINRNLMQR